MERNLHCHPLHYGNEPPFDCSSFVLAAARERLITACDMSDCCDVFLFVQSDILSWILCDSSMFVVSLQTGAPTDVRCSYFR